LVIVHFRYSLRKEIQPPESGFVGINGYTPNNEPLSLRWQWPLEIAKVLCIAILSSLYLAISTPQLN